jgi:hypothetical protein
MARRIWLLSAVSIPAIFSEPLWAYAQNETPAKEVLQACNEGPENVRPRPTYPLQIAQLGRCAGTIETLLALSRMLKEPVRFCPPARATFEQGRQAVVRYGNEKPKALDIPFYAMAVLTFQDAWPCK